MSHLGRESHTQDSDCTLDPHTLCCSVCGVYHGDPCPRCNQHGYHDLRCPVYLDWLARESN